MIQRRRARRGETGQAMTETMLVLAFLMLLIMGTITLCLFMTTKQVADYAAFGAARTALTHGFQEAGADFSDVFSSIGINLASEFVFPVPLDVAAQTGWPSAAQVLYHTQAWWDSPLQNVPRALDLEENAGHQYIVVPFYVPYGLPIFNEIPSGGVLVLGRARVSQQPAELVWRPE
jgi:hypothetical protein